MGRVISFANLKGGVGKSKLNAYFGSFLATAKNHTVCLIDCDVNQKTTEVYDRKSLENFTVIPYDANLGNVANYVLEVSEDYDYTLVDIPGTIQQEGVLQLMAAMDFVIVPTTSEEEDVASSIRFCAYLDSLQVDYRVLMNNYEVQYFGMGAQEATGFEDYQGSFRNLLLPKGIRKNRSLLQQHFVLGDYGTHAKTKDVEETLEMIYNTIEQ